MNYSLETRCIHGDDNSIRDINGALSFPVYQTAPFAHIKPGHNPSGFDYSRESNPTRDHLERLVSSLEGAGETIAYASGMAAVSAAFEYFKSGDHIICGLDVYGGVSRMVHLISRKNGLEVDFIDTRDPETLKNSIKDNTKAVYFETPSNPMMHITDISDAARTAHAVGALLIVDNTLMTPYFQNPLQLGADIVVHSGTKYLCGHNDTVCGFLCTADKELGERFRLLSKTSGAVLGPFECWLVTRGIKTLHLRMERHMENAQKVAAWLKEQPFVRKIYFTGDKDNPQYKLHCRQASGFSGMISFETESKETAMKILQGVKLIVFAESLGGTESLITYPLIQTHPDVPEELRNIIGITDSLLRLSVGLESAEDIIADLKQASEV